MNDMFVGTEKERTYKFTFLRNGGNHRSPTFLDIHEPRPGEGTIYNIHSIYKRTFFLFNTITATKQWVEYLSALSVL